jgi:hypothetical protein
MKTGLTLGTFDNHLMNGLDFCKKVYAFHEQTRESPGGVTKLRIRDMSVKKLVEELIPIARYVQAHYRAGMLLKVRWVLGNQPYDACLLSSGVLAENFPRKATPFRLRGYRKTERANKLYRDRTCMTAERPKMNCPKEY